MRKKFTNWKTFITKSKRKVINQISPHILSLSASHLSSTFSSNDLKSLSYVSLLIPLYRRGDKKYQSHRQVLRFLIAFCFHHQTCQRKRRGRIVCRLCLCFKEDREWGLGYRWDFSQSLTWSLAGGSQESMFLPSNTWCHPKEGKGKQLIFCLKIYFIESLSFGGRNSQHHKLSSYEHTFHTYSCQSHIHIRTNFLCKTISSCLHTRQTHPKLTHRLGNISLRAKQYTLQLAQVLQSTMIPHQVRSNHLLFKIKKSTETSCSSTFWCLEKDSLHHLNLSQFSEFWSTF